MNTGKDTKNIPQKPGFYWAKTNPHYRWFNAIACIYGMPPYMKIRIWHYMEESEYEIGVNDVAEFGPFIPSPIEI